MSPFQNNLTERARQLTREFLAQNQQAQQNKSGFGHSSEQALVMVTIELNRIAMHCQTVEEKRMVVEGFSQGLTQLKWNAEEAARMVKGLEKQVLGS